MSYKKFRKLINLGDSLVDFDVIPPPEGFRSRGDGVSVIGRSDGSKDGVVLPRDADNKTITLVF